MSEALIAAANALSKREQPRTVAAMGLLFQKLSEVGDTVSVEDALLSCRGGAWGEESTPGVGSPILRSTNMRGTRADVNDPAWCLVPPSLAEACELKTGDILVTKASGSIDLVGKAVLFNQPEDDQRYLFSNFVLRLRPNSNIILPEYLAWFLRSPQALMWRFDSQQNAVGLRNLQTKAFLGQCLPLPNSSIQKAVVDYLDAVEVGNSSSDKIELPAFLTEQRRIVDRIDELACKIEEAKGLRREAGKEVTALIQTALTDAFTHDGKTTVGNYITIQSGYAFKSEWFSNSGIRLVRNVNIGHGNIDWRQTEYIPDLRRGEFPRFEIKEGDILISLDRPIISTGVKVAQASEKDLPSLLLQRVGRVCFLDASIIPNYFFAWLRSPNFVSSIDPGRSNGVPHISPKDVERLGFTAPPIAEQARIVAYLDGLQAKVDALKALQAETAAELYALLPSVLDRAFSGRL